MATTDYVMSHWRELVSFPSRFQLQKLHPAIDSLRSQLTHNTAKLARSQLASLRAILPPPLQSLVPLSLSEEGGVARLLNPRNALAAIHPDPTTAVSTLFVTVVLPFILLYFLGLSPAKVFKPLLASFPRSRRASFHRRRPRALPRPGPRQPASMASSDWRSYVGGRYSPFTSTAPSSRPQVTESDYHYIGPDDIVDPPREPYRVDPRSGAREPLDDASQPDILILRHRGATYPMHFPAYVIGEGILRVGELRRKAADKTGTTDPRRLKLLYKGKQLKDDAVACREEGLKQNSELMCVVSEAPIAGRSSSDDGSSASESDFAPRRTDRTQSSTGPGPRVSVDGTIIDDAPKSRRKKDGGSRRKHKSRDDDGPSASNDYLKPQAAPPQQTSRPTTPASTTGPSTTPAKDGPKSPMDQLNAIAETFRTKWLPQCDAFCARPPSDEKSRTQEYTKLSECILAQIIFKLDGVETEGDPEARARRKAIVQETQAVLGRLDAVGKPGSKSPK